MPSLFRTEISLALRKGLREADLAKLLFGEARRRPIPRNARIAYVPLNRPAAYADGSRFRTA